VYDRLSLDTAAATGVAPSLRHNAARGGLLGALIGDSTGSLLEFIRRAPSAQDVENALAMPGGGFWGVAPGQVTDDGELTVALARALAGQTEFPAQVVACNYVRWFVSAPFDIGVTMHTALADLTVGHSDVLSNMLANASQNCVDSKANGSLMRQSALGIWSTRISVAEAINAARLDTRMTHPNLACQWAGVAYVVAIRHLVLHPRQNRAAFAAAYDAVQDVPDAGATQVRDWLHDASGGKLPAFHPHAGYVAIAFTHAFHHLYNATSYVEALRETLAGGGDTDTNACIVGGLVGALHGASGIPLPMARKLLSSNVSKGRPRPEWLQARDALALADALVSDLE
jgi:ADP-ribosylglycohydrolase